MNERRKKTARTGMRLKDRLNIFPFLLGIPISRENQPTKVVFNREKKEASNDKKE